MGWQEQHQVQKSDECSTWVGKIALHVGTSWLKNILAEKSLEVLVNTNLNMDHWCAFVVKKTSRTLSCFRRSVDSTLKEVILPLYSTLCWQIWSTVLFNTRKIWSLWSKHSGGLHRTRDTCPYWRVQQKLMKMITSHEHLSYGEWLRELGLFNLKKRSCRRDFTSMHN